VPGTSLVLLVSCLLPGLRPTFGIALNAIGTAVVHSDQADLSQDFGEPAAALSISGDLRLGGDRTRARTAFHLQLAVKNSHDQPHAADAPSAPNALDV
jgi:hypothetical protein